MFNKRRDFSIFWVLSPKITLKKIKKDKKGATGMTRLFTELLIIFKLMFCSMITRKREQGATGLSILSLSMKSIPCS